MMLCSEEEVEFKKDPFSYWNYIDNVGQSTLIKCGDNADVFKLSLKSKVYLNNRIVHR